MVRIRFMQPDGGTQDVEATVGESLMSAAKCNDVPGVIAECGGSMVCGTCHVYVREPWFEAITPPTPLELDMLDCALHQQATSRLSCQITIGEVMDGMEVGVPPSQR